MGECGQHFDKSLHDAATELGICPTAIKKACRRFGIPRWPFRDRHRLRSHSSTGAPQGGEVHPPAVGGAAATVDKCQVTAGVVQSEGGPRLALQAADTATQEEPPPEKQAPTILKQAVPSMHQRCATTASATELTLPLHETSHALPLMRQHAPRNHSMVGDGLGKSGAALHDSDTEMSSSPCSVNRLNLSISQLSGAIVHGTESDIRSEDMTPPSARCPSFTSAQPSATSVCGHNLQSRLAKFKPCSQTKSIPSPHSTVLSSSV